MSSMHKAPAEETSTFPSLLWRDWLCTSEVLKMQKVSFIFVFPKELFLKLRFLHVKVFSSMTSIINQNRMQNILKQPF